MLIPLTNSPRDYAWGSTTLLAGLEGRAPSGAPEAEVWFGDHPGAPAVVGDGSGRGLDEWIRTEGAAHAITARLPYLVKLLAAGAPLSIQAHPSREQAAAGFAREEALGVPRDAPERNYRDGNHKPEIIVALSDPFLALAGFRPVESTRDLLADIGGAAAESLRARLASDLDLVPAVAWLLGPDGRSTVAGLADALQDAQSDRFPVEVDTARALAAAHPGDPGVAVALLLNVVALRPGEALFMPAGAPHAYLSGLGVEVMAASDNVLRGGLTTKHIDTGELVDVLVSESVEDPRVIAIDEAEGVRAYPVPVDDFRVRRVEAVPSGRTVPVASPAIVVVVSGSVEVADAESGEHVAAGAAVLAAPPDGMVRVGGEGVVFVADLGS